MGAGGRVVIPAALRKALKLKKGDKISIALADNGIRIKAVRQALQDAQEYFSRFKKPGESVVDELIRERREEAAREERE